MKIRNHKSNKSYKIMWSQRPSKLGGLVSQPDILVTGPNPTAALKAFLFGRDRTNISALVWERHSGFPSLSKSGNACFIMKTFEYGVSNP